MTSPASVTDAEVLADLRQRVELDGSRTIATALAVTSQYVRMVLNGKRELSEELALKLGYRKNESTYTKIEGE